MIDDGERDVKELLKRKINWKNVLKAVLGIAMMLLAYFLINVWGGPNNIMLGFMLVCMASSLFVPTEGPPEKPTHTLTFCRCNSCHYLLVKDFGDGDYIFGKCGKCPKCGHDLEVVKIYGVKLTDKPVKFPEKEGKQK